MFQEKLPQPSKHRLQGFFAGKPALNSAFREMFHQFFFCWKKIHTSDRKLTNLYIKTLWALDNVSILSNGEMWSIHDFFGGVKI